MGNNKEYVTANLKKDHLGQLFVQESMGALDYQNQSKSNRSEMDDLTNLLENLPMDGLLKG